MRSFLWIWSHLLKKSLIENFIFCAVCALFVALFVVVSICTFYLKFSCIFLESFLYIQIKLELLSTEIASVLGNKELLSHLRVCIKSPTSGQSSYYSSMVNRMEDGRTVIHWSKIMMNFPVHDCI